MDLHDGHPVRARSGMTGPELPVRRVGAGTPRSATGGTHGSAPPPTQTAPANGGTTPAVAAVELPPGYRPAPDERYMNPRQLAYFRRKLTGWRDRLVEEARRAVDNLRHENRNIGDDIERAARETRYALEAHSRDRSRKLILKIEGALRKIQRGVYGYCEDTGEEIGLARLEARPIAALSVDAQERREFLRRRRLH